MLFRSIGRIASGGSIDWVMIFYLLSVLATREAIDHKVLFSSAFYTHALMAFGHPLAQKKGASYISNLGYRYNKSVALSRHQWRPTGDSSVNAGRHACRWSSVNLSFATPATLSTL